MLITPVCETEGMVVIGRLFLIDDSVQLKLFLKAGNDLLSSRLLTSRLAKQLIVGWTLESILILLVSPGLLSHCINSLGTLRWWALQRLNRWSRAWVRILY